METVILASGSPRRHELLTRVRIPHKVISPDILEDFDPAAPITDIVEGLARRKVEAILEMFKPESPRWVLGVDTVVEVEGRVLGKPASPQEAEAMLASLSGRVHRVWSGLAVHVDRARPIVQEAVCTEVAFRQMSPDEIGFYVETGEWAGAAGAYRIQERGAFFVEWIRGSYSNVVGLPLEAFYGILRRNAFHF
jgi:septum formation protein